jgi:hypothetical protein
MSRHVHLRCGRSLLRQHSRRKDRGRRRGRPRPFPPTRRTHIGSRGSARMTHYSQAPALSFLLPHQPLSEKNRAINNSRTPSWTVWNMETLGSFFRASHHGHPIPRPAAASFFQIRSTPGTEPGAATVSLCFFGPIGRQHCTKALALFFQVRPFAGRQHRAPTSPPRSSGVRISIYPGERKKK